MLNAFKRSVAINLTSESYVVLSIIFYYCNCKKKKNVELKENKYDIENMLY